MAYSPDYPYPDSDEEALDNPLRYKWYIEENRQNLVDDFGEDRVLAAEQLAYERQAGTLTQSQRDLGYTRYDFTAPSAEPSGEWDVYNWTLVAGDEAVATAANLRWQRIYTSPEEAIGFVNDIFPGDPSYYAVMRSTSGLYYVFIAPGTQEAQFRRGVSKAEQSRQRKERARRRADAIREAQEMRGDHLYRSERQPTPEFTRGRNLEYPRRRPASRRKLPGPIEDIRRELRRAFLGPDSVPGTPPQHRSYFQRVARAILDVDRPARNDKGQFRKAPVKRWWRRNL